MNITLDSHLKLIPVEIRKDRKNYIIEAFGEFYEMPEVCIKAILLINEGKILREIEKDLKKQYSNEKVDLLDFTEQLLDLKLVAEIDGVELELLQKTHESLGFLWISPKFSRVFFNKFSYFVYVFLFLSDIVLFISYPKLFPHYKDLFISNLMVLNIPVWIIITLVLVLIHEFGHVLAMRAENLPTKLEVGHRLFLVVLETDMSAVWKLPSQKRNVLYLAGICFDMTVLFLALLGQLFMGKSGILLGIIHVVVLDTFIRVVYQCCVYMKTDIYYFIENVSGCYNLMENAQKMIGKWFPLLRANTADEVIYLEEKRTVFLYSVFYFLGIILTFLLFFFYYIPQLVFSIKKIIPGFSEGLTSLPFWDSAIYSIQLLIGLGLLLFSWSKKYLQKAL